MEFKPRGSVESSPNINAAPFVPGSSRGEQGEGEGEAEAEGEAEGEAEAEAEG